MVVSPFMLVYVAIYPQELNIVPLSLISLCIQCQRYNQVVLTARVE